MKEVQQFYNSFLYPQFFTDNLDELTEKGYKDMFDPSYNKDLDIAEIKNILVIGCGAMQALLLAYNNKDINVDAVDFSDNVIQYNTEKKGTYKLNNLALYKSHLAEFTTDKTYDLVICTGVLHHGPFLEQRIRFLLDMLGQNGKLCLSLYNKIGRHVVYEIQQILKLCDLELSNKNVDILDNIFKNLPENHTLFNLVNKCTEVTMKNNFIDTFFHPYDNPLTILELGAIIKENNFNFHRWHHMDFGNKVEEIEKLDFFKRYYCYDILSEQNVKINFTLEK